MTTPSDRPAALYPPEVMEQVARAIYESSEGDFLKRGIVTTVTPWENLKEHERDFGRLLARAALTASPLAAVTAERDRLRKLLAWALPPTAFQVESIGNDYAREMLAECRAALAGEEGLT